MTTASDLAALTTAVGNVYEHAGPAETFFGQVQAALAETPPDVASANTALAAAAAHVAYMAYQSVDAQAAAAALNADLNPPAPPSTTGVVPEEIPGGAA